LSRFAIVLLVVGVVDEVSKINVIYMVLLGFVGVQGYLIK